ncbi:PrpR N-terminal domain-containing protein [Planomicrobium chinense]|uniref:sigma-54-dependent transcriptional regulator n=1 Tax=Planococcus chinensis TaxID=272917 RepID=UPI001CC34002|nr:sigma-54-dependent transcriptional regulator [Planococcus chinensis]MBZ5200562.1 PrpR N-terminal domain-containing protein [Planococcus chinensis]
MRKINIGFISPYDAMVPVIEELKNGQHDLMIHAVTGNLEKGVALARELEQQGMDMLISRGGTAKLIRDAVTLPVIDVQISGYDLLRSIMLASGHRGEKKALVGFANITIGAASIVSLLEIDLKVVTLTEASDVEPVLNGLKAEGYTRILGDVITVNAAQQLGLNGLLIQSGRESILQSLEEARRLYKTQQKTQQLLRIFEYLLTEREQDFFIAEEDGKVLYENWSSFERLPLAPNEINSLLQQVKASDSPVLKIFTEVELPFSIRGTSWQDQKSTLFAFFFKQLSISVHELGGGLAEKIHQLPSLAAESAAMKNIRQLLEEPLLATTPIILEGLPGSGKETLARYVHAYHQKKGYFAVLPIEDLKNSFSELHALNVSTLLLTVAKSPSSTAVREIKEQLDVLAAQNIQVILAAEEIQPKLIDSLNMQEAVRIVLPNLTDRQGDFELMVHQFLTEFHQSLGTLPIKIRDDAMQELKKNHWNGNANELKAYIKKLALAEKEYVIEKSTVLKNPSPVQTQQKSKELFFENSLTLKEMERKIIEQVLQEEGFNQTKTAKRLGINRATLWRKLKE